MLHFTTATMSKTSVRSQSQAKVPTENSYVLYVFTLSKTTFFRAAPMAVMLLVVTLVSEVFTSFKILIDQVLTQKPGKISLLLRGLILTPEYKRMLKNIVVVGEGLYNGYNNTYLVNF